MCSLLVVFHNNHGFGFYINVGFPRNVVYSDENGDVSDWDSCAPFNFNTGADNAQTVGGGASVNDHVEYMNDFNMGAYDTGDVTFNNVVVGLGNKGMYFKTYRRAATTGPLCTNCTFYSMNLHMEAPGGSALVEFKDSRFISTSASSKLEFAINHHCGFSGEQTGSLCASTYSFPGTSTFGYPDGTEGKARRLFTPRVTVRST